MVSTTELSNRSLLGGGDEGGAGTKQVTFADARGAESKTPSEGSVGSTLETPLLQGGGNGEVKEFEDEKRFKDVCVEFRQTGACEFGDRCHFSHGTIGDICVEFKQTGACEFGDRCHFVHIA